MNAVLKAYTLSECMEVMSEYACAYERKGGKNVIFCEDRLTLIAERALLARSGGSFFTSVSTFARFLEANGQTISKQGSVMAVGEVMTRLQREKGLQCFKSILGVGRNARCIYETLAQFSASEITPQILRESLALLPDDMLKKKIADLALIYEGYQEFLAENAVLDESKYLSMLPKRIREEGLLKGCNVFFLCYSSFTKQARETVRAALETADNVIGVFCAGEEELYANHAVEAFEEVCAEFGKTQVRALGTPLNGEAEILRKRLFNPVRTQALETENVQIFEGGDKNAEAEYVAVKIRREMAESERGRYRDFAVLVPDVAAYALPLKKAFGEYKIPYFIDEKKSLKRHPLSRFLLDCFRIVRENFSPIATQSLCENLFFGESDEYRNYLLKFANYRGGAKREIKRGESVEESYDIAALEDGRARVLSATKNIKTKGQGRDYCLAVRQILKDFQVEERLKTLEENVEDLSQKGYLSQIYRALEGVLSEAERLTGAKELTVAEFEMILQDGLEATEISLIPLKSDAVFIGNIADSRIEKVRTLFAMGMTDDVPRRSIDVAIVSDGEIERLAEVKTRIEPTVAQVNLRTRENVCLNLCTFLDKLYLTYPRGVDGNEPTLSEIFRYLDGAFCEAGGGKLLRRKKYTPADFKYRCAALSPAIRQLLIEKNEYECKGADTRLEYSSLYSALDKLSVTEKDEYLRERTGQVCVECGEDLFFHNGKISPTALESYFSCPFRHFAQKGLKLTEREETAVQAMDTGNFIHELLDKTAQRAAEFATEEELRAFALQEGEKLLKGSIYAMQQDTGHGLHFAEKLLQEGAGVAVAAFRQIKNSAFSVEGTEIAVDGGFFHGKVDRVDSGEGYVRVVDYKTGFIDDSAAAYYTGKKLQMQLYMSEIMGERIPAGVFYFPAALEFTGEEEGRFRMKGFLNGNRDALLCGDKNLTEEKKSEYFPAALKNGARAKRVMDEETFRYFIDYSTYVAKQGCRELRQGYIGATPYDGACKYCKYGGMCGYNKELKEPRKEREIDPTAIANIVKKEKGGND